MREPTPTGDQVFIHPTAVVEDGAEIGEGTKVWHFAHVRAGASIGTHCTIGKDVFVDSTVRIGSACKLQNGTSVYAGVTIEDEVFVGPHVAFTNDLHPRATSTTWQIVETRLRRGCSIGANATIVCGVEIGAFAMVGAGSVVTRGVASHQLVTGNPARHAGWVCECGRTCSRDAEPPAAFRCELHSGDG